MDKTISFIGAGNMGGAILEASCRQLNPKQIFVTDPLAEKAELLAQTNGCNAVPDNAEAVKRGEYIFLCVKPQIMPMVLKEISPVLGECLSAGEKKVLISIAAGITIEGLRSGLDGDAAKASVIRVMPNTSASIGKGMLAISAGKEIPGEILEDIRYALEDAGRVEVIPERLMDQFTVVSGSTPAFVYMFIEALADGGVMAGLPRDQAILYAAQAVMGAASMVIETGQHPGELKDNVCSPAGSTIAGVSALEDKGFRGAVMDAVMAGYKRNQELGK